MSTPEADLLLDCLRQESDPSTISRLRALTDRQWADLADLAIRKRTGPLLHHHLRAKGLLEDIPSETAEKLRDVFRRQTLVGLFFQAWLIKTAKVFKAEGVPIIVLKGAHLVHEAYENCGLRPMNDIDLLTPPAHLEKAGRVLEDLGFKPQFPYRIELEPETSKHLPSFFKSDAPIIEMHWNITSPGRPHTIDPAEFRERARVFQAGGRELWGLSPEDLLLNTAGHLAYEHDFQFGLLPFCDLDRIIRRFQGELDWGAVIDRAERWKWGRGTYLALRCAGEFFDAPVPESVLERLRPPDFDPVLIDLVRGLIFETRPEPLSRSAPVLEVLGRKGLISRLTGLLGRVFLPRPVMARLYDQPPDSWRLLFFYPLRLVDLISRRRREVWLSMSADRETAAFIDKRIALTRWLSRE